MSRSLVVSLSLCGIGSGANYQGHQSNDATRTSQDQKTLDDFLAQETFKSITDMDEGDPNQEFSRGIVASFLDQASKTISEMKDLLGYVVCVVCS